MPDLIGFIAQLDTYRLLECELYVTSKSPSRQYHEQNHLLETILKHPRVEVAEMGSSSTSQKPFKNQLNVSKAFHKSFIQVQDATCIQYTK